jgi:alkylation response protein AidB-like acyl-CoA dehydrogenase
MTEVTAPVAPPSADELVARARELVPLLRRNALDAVKLRRLPDESVDALTDAGIFRMTQPRRFGGYELDAASAGDVMSIVASGCVACAWVLGIYTGVDQLVRGLREEAMAEAYSGPHPRFAAVFGRVGGRARRVDGGFRLIGRGVWPFNSGCHHATWDLLIMAIEEPDGSEWIAQVIVPMSELTILDDWYVGGASGTGSNSVTAEELFVPEHRVAPSLLHNRETAAKAIPLSLRIAIATSMPLGIARQALEAFLDGARTATLKQLGFPSLAETPIAQHAVAEAAIRIDLIDAHIMWAQDIARRYDDSPPPAELAAIRAGNAYCLRMAREAIEGLYDVSPPRSIGEDQVIQRLAREARAFERREQNGPLVNREAYGRFLCGLPAVPGRRGF